MDYEGANLGPLRFGEWLKAQRARTNMSKEWLAHYLDVPVRTIVSWEQGERYPRFPRLIKLCEVLGCDSINPQAEWGRGPKDPAQQVLNLIYGLSAGD